MGNIYIENRKCKIEKIREDHPGALICDLTSKSDSEEYRVLSPFYPHYGIPVPGMENETSACVEGVWQGLKVFETCGVDTSCFRNDTMKDIKRTVRRFGKPLGHQFGDKRLPYFEARMQIYLPTYKLVLVNKDSAKLAIDKIKEALKKQDVVFLDYNTNCDVRDCRTPLSHAGLVKLYIEDKYPEYKHGMKPYTDDELAEKKANEEAAKKEAAKKKTGRKSAKGRKKADDNQPTLPGL